MPASLAEELTNDSRGFPQVLVAFHGQVKHSLLADSGCGRPAKVNPFVRNSSRDRRAQTSSIRPFDPKRMHSRCTDKTDVRRCSVLFDTLERSKENARSPIVHTARDHELKLGACVRKCLKNACEHSGPIEDITGPDVDFVDGVWHATTPICCMFGLVQRTTAKGVSRTGRLVEFPPSLRRNYLGLAPSRTIPAFWSSLHRVAFFAVSLFTRLFP